MRKMRNMEGEKLAEHLELAEVRKLVVAAAAVANSKDEVLENAENENMEQATDRSENMQGGFDYKITPLDGGENMQGGFDAKIIPPVRGENMQWGFDVEITPRDEGENMQRGDRINTQDHGLHGGTNDEACSSWIAWAKGDTNKKRKAKKLKTKKVQNADKGLENEDSSSTEIFHDSDYDFDDKDSKKLNSNASDGEGDEINERMRKYPSSRSNPGSTVLLASRTNDDGDEITSKSEINPSGVSSLTKKSTKYPDKLENGKDQQDGQSAVDGATAQDDACVGGNTENSEGASIEPTATPEHGTCVAGDEKIVGFEQTEDETWLDELISSTTINIPSQQPILSSSIRVTK
ncbi:hypothetical protein ACH5RR_013657 [Cinchona calisaya]|uniref:Uncharacterized protein n=1 Tax=Cinchona calisaya TaxID=153742 RepID=A0ABD3A422_9GENT